MHGGASRGRRQVPGCVSACSSTCVFHTNVCVCTGAALATERHRALTPFPPPNFVSEMLTPAPSSQAQGVREEPSWLQPLEIQGHAEGM